MKEIREEHQAFLDDLLKRLGLRWSGDWYRTASLKTVRDIVRPGSSTANGWGAIAYNNALWEMYHVHAGEIAHGAWESEGE